MRKLNLAVNWISIGKTTYLVEPEYTRAIIISKGSANHELRHKINPIVGEIMKRDSSNLSCRSEWPPQGSEIHPGRRREGVRETVQSKTKIEVSGDSDWLVVNNRTEPDMEMVATGGKRSHTSNRVSE